MDVYKVIRDDHYLPAFFFASNQEPVNIIVQTVGLGHEVLHLVLNFVWSVRVSVCVWLCVLVVF